MEKNQFQNFLQVGQKFIIQKFNQNWYLGAKENITFPVYSIDQAIFLKAIPVQLKDNDLINKYDEYYLINDKGQFLERIYLILDDLESVHKAGRFKVGFNDKPTQTVKFLSEHDTNIQIAQKCGISFGGINSDPLNPSNQKRTVMTFRDEQSVMPQAVVSWWQGDEFLQIIR